MGKHQGYSKHLDMWAEEQTAEGEAPSRPSQGLEQGERERVGGNREAGRGIFTEKPAKLKLQSFSSTRSSTALEGVLRWDPAFFF